MAGIYGGDPHHLEAATCLSRFVQWEQEHGGLMRGGFANRGASREPTGSFTFTHGVQQLVDTLASALGDAVQVGVAATAIHHGAGVRVETSAGPVLDADSVVVTCAPDAARALLPDLPIPSAPRSPVAAVHLGYRAADIPGGLPGFGWLVHSRERRDVLGCLWVSGTFPGHAPAGHHVVRLMVGGTRAPELAHLPDAELIAHVRRVLQQVQGVGATPVLEHISRARPGIPQYPPGFGADLARLRVQAGPRVRFAGWFYGGIGIADGIAAARALRVSLG
jgi:oxygen-dependent protoporphyrinogen oxidase